MEAVMEALVNEESDKVVALLQYKQYCRQLHSAVLTHQETTRKLSDQRLHQQRTLFAVNQRHNALLSDIQHQRGRRFESVELVCYQVDDINGVLNSDRDTVLQQLQQEISIRRDASKRLVEKQQELVRVAEQLQVARQKRQSLRQKLQLWLSCSQAADIYGIIASTCSTDNKEQVDLRTVFEACCLETAPCWEQLRYFPVEQQLKQEEDDHQRDPLFKQQLAHIDHLRFRLSDLLVVTVTLADNLLAVKMDAVEYKLTEEEADFWMRTITDHANITTPADLIAVLSRLKQVFKDEQDLYDDCQADGPFKDISKTNNCHTFTFTVSDAENAAAATVTTAPRRHWHLQPIANSDEAFATRCRLVQERLNHADMAASPIALQLAFLRKLVS